MPQKSRQSPGAKHRLPQALKERIKATGFLYPLLQQYYRLKYRRLYPPRTRYLPTLVQIETTNLCNARCSCCPHEKMTRPKGVMSWELFERIIDQCAAFEGKGLMLYLHKDGDPFLDPLLFRRIAYARSRLPQSHLHFNSNAALLTQEKTAELLASPIDSITFSVDGISPETYEPVRLGLCYEVVRSNLKYFFAERRRVGHRMKVNMQMVVYEKNRHEIEAYKALWLGEADTVTFKPMHNFLDMCTSVSTPQLSGHQLRFCPQPFEVLVIYWNGEVGLCCWDYDNRLKLGEVTHEGLAVVYNNPHFQRVRQAMHAFDCSRIPLCNRCSIVYGKDKLVQDLSFSCMEGRGGE